MEKFECVFKVLTFLFGSLEAVYSPPLCPAPYHGHAVVPRGVSWVPPKKKKKHSPDYGEALNPKP